MTEDSFLPLGLETPAEDVDALRQLVAECRRPGQDRAMVAEVGSWAGRTARAMADAGALVWCVDTWEGSVGDTVDDTERLVRAAGGPDAVFRAFCKNAGGRFLRTVFPCRGPSAVWASVWPYQMDLVFIDADHRYEAVKADIAAWAPKVRPGGVMAFHDYLIFEGVTRAVRESFPAGGVETAGRTLGLVRWPA